MCFCSNQMKTAISRKLFIGLQKEVFKSVKCIIRTNDILNIHTWYYNNFTIKTDHINLCKTTLSIIELL